MTTRSHNPLLAAAAAMLLLGSAGPAGAAILFQIPGLKGDSTMKGFEGWFVASSFSFGVEREMRESGEKGGTEDINIGVGELQECTISKSLDGASAQLAQFAMNGNSLGTVDIVFVEPRADGKPFIYLSYKLERAFVKSWSTSGDADDRPTEQVAFYFNKIAFSHTSATGGSSGAGWDAVRNMPFSIGAPGSAPR